MEKVRLRLQDVLGADLPRRHIAGRTRGRKELPPPLRPHENQASARIAVALIRVPRIAT